MPDLTNSLCPADSDNQTSFSIWENSVGEIPVLTLRPLIEKGLPRIMIIYGGTTKKNFRLTVRQNYAEKLAHWGFIVHCFDFRSNLEGNSLTDFGLYDRLQDLRAVFGWLAGYRLYRHIPLVLLGVSMGGYLAVHLAVERPQDVYKLILIAPAAYADKACQPEIKFGQQFRSIISEPDSWRTSSIFKKMRSIRVPSLIIRFEKDEVVPTAITDCYFSGDAYSLRMLEREMITFKNMTHGSIFTDPKKKEMVLNFAARFLFPSSSG